MVPGHQDVIVPPSNLTFIYSSTPPFDFTQIQKMTKRKAPQLDFDETILYAEMAHESGADTTRKRKVRFNLPTIKHNGLQ